MAERPTTSASSRPYTAGNGPRPLTGWSESEAPSTSHGPTNYAYPAHYYQHQQQQAQAQHLPNQHHLYAQQEESYTGNDDDDDDDDDDGESDDGDVFAYGPPLTSEHGPQPHQMQYSQQQHQNQHHLQQQQQHQQQQQQQQQDMSQHQHLSAAQLHNLVAAAGLSTTSSAHPPPPSSGLSSIPESPTAPNSSSHGAHDHHHSHQSHQSHHSHTQPPETSSSYEYEPGPNSYSMRPIPISPGILDPQHTAPSPALGPISYANVPPREPLQVVLPTTANSNDSSVLSPAQLKRVSTDPNTSALDLGSQTLTMSYKLTDIDAAEEEEDSPYPEVRASVSNMDDPEMPTLTFRMWFIGLTLVVVGVSLNTFFMFRYPAPFFLPNVILLIAYPLGKALALILPIRTWVLPRILGGHKFSLNPGPFNVKEHVLIYMMANVGAVPAYVINAIVVADKYYSLSFGPGFEILLILATTLTGFGLAGLCRGVLVKPASMIWPQNLVSCALLNTLHAEDDDDRNTGISRYKFFMYAMGGIFLWTFLPSFLFVALSYFSWVCWMAPNNLVVNQLFGTVSGLGMGFITFDWSQIAYVGSPLMVPWWALVHMFAGFVVMYWLVLPILYYTNTWNLAYLPIVGRNTYDRFGRTYNVTRILDSTGRRFNLAEYEAYSALYLPGPYAIVYLLAFALSTALLVHTVLYHSRMVYKGIKRVQVEDEDVHEKLMRAYPEVPDSWYASICLAFFMMAIVVIEVWPTDMPVWALALSVLIPALYLIPCGIIYAVTTQSTNINLLAEIIPGVLLNGRPLANMIFKAYAVQTLGSALAFIQDLKLGHYMKVPPKASFMAQAVATILSGIIQVGVKTSLFATVPDICSETQKSSLVCPHNRVFFSASAIWGLIGPTRQFGSGSLYHGHLWALLVGAFLPIPFWWWQRRFPKTRLKYINVPVFLNGPIYIPPATGINYSSWFLTGFIFQYLVRKRNFRWWSKFNYILSAALDSGTVFSIIFIFLTLQLPKSNTIAASLDWWGNTAPFQTVDGMGPPAAYIPLAPGDSFDDAPGGQ